MVSERVKEKNQLQKVILKLINQHDGFRTYETETETDNSFASRPQDFLKELEELNDLDIVLEKLKDYPFEEGVKRDIKQWRVKIAKKSDTSIRCNLKMTIYGQDEFGGVNKTELSISGGCYIEPKKKEPWWEDE